MTNLKDSGVYWLGEVADDFDIVPSTIVFKERSDKNLEDDVHLTPSQKYGVLPQDKYQEITGGKVMQKLSNSDMKHVEPDDFVIHLRSFQGGIERSQIRGKVSTAYTVLEPRDGVFTGYWRYFLKSAPFIEGMASSTDQLRDGQTINYARFSRLKLLRPPLETQRRIADYLDKEISEMDALIEEFEGLSKNLGIRKRLLIDSIFEENVPRLALKFLADFIPGFAFPSTSFTDDPNCTFLFRGVNLKPGIIDPTDSLYFDGSIDVPERYVLQEGDVVLGMDRPFIKSGVRVATISQEFEGSFKNRGAYRRLYPLVRLCSKLIPFHRSHHTRFYWYQRAPFKR